MTETMTNADMLAAGVNLMLLGMLVVFSLLGVLVFVVGGMSRLARKLEGAPRAVELPAASVKAPEGGELLSVISAAIHRYRRSRGK